MRERERERQYLFEYLVSRQMRWKLNGNTSIMISVERRQTAIQFGEYGHNSSISIDGKC